MRLTERQARIRLGAAIAAAGGQTAFAKSIGLPVGTRSNATTVSRSVRGPTRIHPTCLAAVGLRRDAAGEIHTVEPARLQVLMVRAKGNAAVRAATAIVSTILGRNQ